MFQLARRLRARLAPAVRSEQGFTLVELLVVVIIIGILAAIAIPLFITQQQLARDASVQSAVSIAKTEIALAIVETGEFPPAGELDDVLTAHGDAAMTVALTGTPDEFCISGTHSDASTSWATGRNTGLTRGATCTAGGEIQAG